MSNTELISSDPETIRTAGQAGAALPPALPSSPGEVWEPEWQGSGQVSPAAGAQRAELAPIPLIGSVDLAGVIVVAEAVSVPAGGWLVIGEKGNPRPSALGLVLIAAAVGVEIQGDQQSDSSVPGFPIPSTRELQLHARRARLHNTTGAAVTVSYLLVTLAG